MSLKRTPVKKNEAPTLTAKAIKAAEHREKDYWIAGEAGLFIRIYPKRDGEKESAKTFYHVWTKKGTTSKNRLKLGNFIEDEKSRTKEGQLTLPQAVKRNREVIDQIDKGIDPRAQNLGEEIKNWHNMTFEDLTKVYIDFLKDPINRAPKTHEVYEQIINTYVLPKWRNRKLTDIKRSDAKELILNLKKQPKVHPSFENETITGIARQVLKTCRAMFNYQIDNHEEEAQANPFSKLGKIEDIAPIMNTKKTERSLKKAEVIKLWHTLSSADGWGSNASRRALLLCLVTGQRPGEVAGLHSREIDEEWWQLPKARIKTRNKNPRDHRVFLSPLARRIIDDRKGYIFPSTDPERIGESIVEDTLSQLVNSEAENIDLNSANPNKRRKPKWLGLDSKWTPNDLRKTVSTGLASIRCPQEIIDKILNHQLGGARARYNLFAYDFEKEEWLTKWSKHLEKLVGQQAFDIHQTNESYDVEQLRELTQKYPLQKVGEILGVSGNAIKKRCLKHGIEFFGRGYWQKPENRNYILPKDQPKPEPPVDLGYSIRRIIRYD